MSLVRTACLAAALAAVPFAPAATTLAAESGKASTGLIPRKDIFGNPTRANPVISPDGTAIAFLAPRDGVLNVWVAPVGAMDEAKPITAETVRPIGQFFWAPDSSRILYLQDQGGTEDFQLFGVDLNERKTVPLTPFEKTQAQVIAVSPDVPDAILVGLNNRDPQWHDVHRLNLKTGELTLVREGTGYAGFDADRQLNLRLATRPTADGGFQVDRILKDGKTEPFMTVPGGDSLTTGTAGFTGDGRTLYLLDSRERDKSGLFAKDMETGKTTLVAESGKADVGGTLRNPKTGVVEAYSVDYLKEEWTPVGDAVKADIAFLNTEIKGSWNVLSRTLDDTKWTLRVDQQGQPVSFYLYDRPAKKLEKLFVARPQLEGRTLAAMHPVEIKARDGLTLVSYLSLPPGSDKDGNGRPEQPVPLVLNVHGGPWARDSFGYNPEHIWLADRGYAVLSVNFRGSTGFGKAFVNAGDKQWGRKMHDDLIDAVNWAIKEGVAPKDKVAIYGGSYGGYATLWGMTNTPEVFACGVDIVGPSNLITLLNSIPPYWASFLEVFAQRVGDPRTEEGKKLLEERSPLTHVQNIGRPLLIAQGANDPRVKQAESDQIVAAMKKKDIPVTYVLYPDEGHGFARPPNRISFYAVTEGFLSQCLGGAYEPVGDDFQGASLQVPEGAGYVPGLKEALAARK